MIVLIRHGQTTTERRSDSSSVAAIPRSPNSVNARRSRLRPFLGRVRRGVDLAAAACAATAALAIPDVEAVVKESFIEVDYGSMDGQSLSLVSEEQWRAFEHDHDTAFGDGESLASVDQRVHAELRRLLTDPSSLLHSATADLAIVTHMSPIKSAVTWALGVPGSAAWRMNLRNASITTIATRRSTPALFNYNVVPEVE